MRPTWIAFDLNGTLTDVRALTGDERALDVFDAAILLTMAGTLCGEIRPLPEYFRAVLERDLPEEADRAMAILPRLPTQPDAAAALGTVRAAGYRVAVVTNSAEEAGHATLRAAGLAEHVEAVVGADGAGAYKPDSRVYGNARRRLGVPATELCLVSAHAWDVLGAIRAGWQAAWVGHREQRLLATVPEPLVSAPTLLDAAQQLARL